MANKCGNGSDCKLATVAQSEQVARVQAKDTVGAIGASDANGVDGAHGKGGASCMSNGKWHEWRWANGAGGVGRGK